MEILNKYAEILNIKPVICQFNNQNITNKGIYQLDNESFIILLPEYSKIDYTKIIMNNEFQRQNTRSTIHYGPEYLYSNIVHKENNNWDPIVLVEKAKIESKFLTPLNSCLLNLYTKNDYMPYHQDNEECLANETIFSLSSGETKNITFKSTNDTKKLATFQMNNGTLLIMVGQVNKNYIHGVTTKCKNERLNLTFRLLKSPIFDKLLEELNQIKKAMATIQNQLIEKDKKISILENLLTEKIKENAKNITLMQNQMSKNLSTSNTIKKSVVILKSDITPNSNADSYTQQINMHLTEDSKLNADEIQDIQDYRDKKGPIVITFKTLSAKIKALKVKNKQLIIKNCLNQQNTILRKRALLLKAQNIIKNVWEYKGDIFFTKIGHEEKIQASLEIIVSLEEQHGFSSDDILR